MLSTRDATLLHSDLFPEFPFDTELTLSRSTLDGKSSSFLVLWLRYGVHLHARCEWVTVVYPGMKSDLEV